MNFQSKRKLENRTVALAIGGFLALSTAVSLVCSHYKMIEIDEFFELWTDRASTIRQVVHIQQFSPLSLDPLAYHALVHVLMLVAGANAFSIRLPSLLGYLLMEICLFVFVWRLAGARAGLVALLFPSLTEVFPYSFQGRPYGMMLGLLALAMVSWQTAVHRDSNRTGALIALAASLALILNLNYTGTLLVVPFLIAEGFRCFQRKRADLPVLGSIFVGIAGYCGAIPFMKAAAQFRRHYYFPADLLTPRRIGWMYVWLLSNGVSRHGFAGRLIFYGVLTIVLIGVATAICGITFRWRSEHPPLPQADASLLAGLVAIPVFGYLLGFFVTHAYEPNHNLGYVVGITPLVAVGLSRFVRNGRNARVVLGVMFVAFCVSGVDHILDNRLDEIQNSRSDLKAALISYPKQPLYDGEFDSAFFDANYYETDADVRSRFVLLYSRTQELRVMNSDTGFILTHHLHEFTGARIQPWESIIAEPGEHVFLAPSDGVSVSLFEEYGACIRLLGTAFGDEILSVNFHPVGGCTN